MAVAISGSVCTRLQKLKVSDLWEQSWIWTNVPCSGTKEFPFSGRTRSRLQFQCLFALPKWLPLTTWKLLWKTGITFAMRKLKEKELSCSRGAWPETPASSFLFTYTFLSSFWHLLQVSSTIPLCFS